MVTIPSELKLVLVTMVSGKCLVHVQLYYQGAPTTSTLRAIALRKYLCTNDTLERSNTHLSVIYSLVSPLCTILCTHTYLHTQAGGREEERKKSWKGERFWWIPPGMYVCRTNQSLAINKSHDC